LSFSNDGNTKVESFCLTDFTHVWSGINSCAMILRLCPACSGENAGHYASQ
jgi:hypothetical protein